jgi:type I restriction enzyme S subunit
MTRYNSYQDSGNKWIGEIPSHWLRASLGKVGVLYGGLTGKKGEDFRSENSALLKPFIPFTNIFNNTYISKEHFQPVVIGDGENQNKVQRFDLFFLMSSESYEDLGKTSILIDDVDELYLNSFCKGFRVQRTNLNPLFLNYQLSGDTHKKLISIEGNGFTRINLRQDRLKETPIFIPPLSEQQQIVTFLDTTTLQIDELIQKKIRKIELLKEYRISLINHVVTKGLNPNVKMKDSGVEWIGEIPSHWEKIKLGHYTIIVRGGSPRPSGDPIYFNGDFIPWITVGDVTNSEGKFLVKTETFLTEEGMNNSRVLESETLVISNSGATLGVPKILKIKGCINDGSVGFPEINDKLKRDFLYYFFVSQTLLLRKQQSGYGQPNLNTDIISNIRLPLPPLSEQHEIVSYLDEQTEKIDSSIQLEKKKIKLLKEYRQSLISEVVTGKIKVF